MWYNNQQYKNMENGMDKKTIFSSGAVVAFALSIPLVTSCVGLNCCDSSKVRTLSVAEYRDKMAGAWLGQSIGVAYGWPTEFRKNGELFDWDKLPVWKSEMINETFSQDDLYVEMSFLQTLEARGIDVGVREAGIDFANSRYRLWCANANARDNLRRGIAAPSSSHPKNHATTDDIDYQIEADFSGILAPGMPRRVLKLGEQFGRIMNYGDGYYAGVFVGGLYAAAYFESDRVKTVESALRCIPQECLYAKMVRDMLAWYAADPKDWRRAWKLAVDEYGKNKKNQGRISFPAIDAKLNGAMVLLGYLWGDGDIEKTMKISTAGGYDSDCNPSSALGVLGAQIGAKAFGEKYIGKLDRTKKWEFTNYTYDDLLAVCEKLTRQYVVVEGGKIEGSGANERFVIPVREAEITEVLDSFKPGPGGDERLTEEENASILYLPCASQGAQSEKKTKAKK